MAIGQTLIDFCRKKGIGQEKVDEETDKFIFHFKEKDLHDLQDLGCVMDASKGGLVLGNLHSEGGIQLIRKNAGNEYVHSGEMEGWEYLTSPLQWIRSWVSFETLNSGRLDDLTEDTSFDIPKDCKVIDTRGVEVPILLLDDNYNQFIMSRYATRKYINKILELDLINRYANNTLDNIIEELRG